MIDIIVDDKSDYFSMCEENNTITLYVTNNIYNTLIMDYLLDRLKQIK